MKIAFDHDIFTRQSHGGVSRYFAQLAAHLPAYGVTPRIIAPFHVNAYLGALPRSVVTAVRLPDNRWTKRLARAFDTAASGSLLAAACPEIVHETYYAERRRAPARARIVLTVYDMIHELFPAMFATDDPTRMHKRAAVMRADHILCISENTRRDLVAVIPEAAAKSSVTLLGFDVIAVPPKTLPATRPYLLYVGQRGGYKNFAGLLQAFAASTALRREFDLVAVGGGGFSAAEFANIHGHGLQASVRQVAAADDAALQRWYAGAAVFVYPSLYEGFGIPPLEAMAAGTPVVAMRASSVPEVCGDAAAYADPDDPGSLVAALEAVALAPAEAQRLTALGTARLAHFSWDRCASTTAEAYRSLV